MISGRVDRLERLADGSLRVIDYKTGSASSKPREDDLPTHPQLGAYQLAVTGGAFAEHGTASGGAALLQIGKGANKRDITLQEQRPLQTHDDPQWASAWSRRRPRAWQAPPSPPPSAPGATSAP